MYYTTFICQWCHKTLPSRNSTNEEDNKEYCDNNYCYQSFLKHDKMERINNGGPCDFCLKIQGTWGTQIRNGFHFCNGMCADKFDACNIDNELKNLHFQFKVYLQYKKEIEKAIEDTCNKFEIGFKEIQEKTKMLDLQKQMENTHV